MNILKVKATICCNICGCKMRRTKTIKVLSNTPEEAKIEARQKITDWQNGLIGQNCKTCTSILASV